MYELWQLVEDNYEIMPLFLIERGDFDDLYIKFKKNKTSIITDKEGLVIESHIEFMKK